MAKPVAAGEKKGKKKFAKKKEKRVVPTGIAVRSTSPSPFKSESPSALNVTGTTTVPRAVTPLPGSFGSPAPSVKTNVMPRTLPVETMPSCSTVAMIVVLLMQNDPVACAAQLPALSHTSAVIVAVPFAVVASTVTR